MRIKSIWFIIVVIGMAFMGCPNPAVDTPVVLTPSTITFADGAAVSKQIGSGNYTNVVSGDGTGAITYESGTTTTATVNETTGEVTLVAVGSTVIAASKAETATHAAVSESYTLTVTALTPSTIVFADGASVSRQIGSGNYTNAVSGDGTGAIFYSSGTPGTATVNVTTGEVTLVAVGSTVITAAKAATATHETATNTYTLTVTALTPSTIVFANGATVSKQLGSGNYTNAVSGDGTGAITYSSATLGTATINETTGEVTLVAVGSTVITATKAATATFEAVTNTYTLTVNAIPSTIVFANGATVSKQLGSGSYTNAVSGDGTGAITYSSATPGTATVNSTTGEVALVAVGSTVITAVKAATATHETVTNTYTLTVTAIPVTFSGATQIGGASNSDTTTSLTLTFDVDPTTLSASDISVTGATKGALSGTGTTRSLTISAITVANGETVSVSVANPTGYAITGSPQSAVVYKVSPVTLSAILGLTAPVHGATPVTTITETAQYTGTASWNGSPTTFAASTVYTATITLTAKAGFTLTGVAADFFTVAGTTSDSNPVNSGVITAVFPVTEAVPDTVVNIAAIPGVTATVTGATPVTTITETAQYTGTVTWSPAVSNMFVSNTTYSATITLIAKAGFTLTGVAANFFTVAGTTSDGNPVNSGVVTAIFPVTMANLAAVTDYTGTSVGILKAVRGGTFNNGTADMTVSSFRMSQYEITRAQFVAMLTTDPTDTTYSTADTTNPVQMTSWYHAIAFCNKLSIAEGLTPVYAITGVSFTTLTYAVIPTTDNGTWNAATADWSANGYRLPTEMEWMWAAMGGKSDRSNGNTGTGTNTTGYTKGYSGSTEVGVAQVNIGNYAWYSTNSGAKSHPVGTAGTTGHPNELGLYDMSGNVWEWCWDWYVIYPGTRTDYRGAASGTRRIFRGGSRDQNEAYCTVAYRSYSNPYGQGSNVGFRVVRP